MKQGNNELKEISYGSNLISENPNSRLIKEISNI